MLSNVLKRKSVLFIGVEFYHYHLEIHRKMEHYGANVTFYSERDTSIKYGIVNRLFPKWLDKFQQSHYSSILKNIKGQTFDYLLVIRGYKMPLWFVQAIKKNNPNIKTIMYQWDANVNSPFLDLPPNYNVIDEFDRKFSFDYRDVEDHPALLKYSPTFYTDEIKDLAHQTERNVIYDFFYFGSYLPERYEGLLRFKTYVELHGYSLKTHFYMPLRYYLIERLKGTKLDSKLLSYKKMKREVYIDLLQKSKAIVDVSNAKQTGMAMRVIDALGAGKKILTTNKWITRDENCELNQIVIIDMKNISIPSGFLETKVQPVKFDFSIDKWLYNMFCS